MNVRETWFRTPERVQALQAAAARWVGTPWVWGSAVCQSGVDCVRLCAALYAETGALPEPMGWMPDWRSHSSRRIDAAVMWLESGRDGAGSYFCRVPERGLLAGDLLMFSGAHLHFAVVLPGGEFIHAINPHGAILGHLGDVAFMSRLVGAWCVAERNHGCGTNH